MDMRDDHVQPQPGQQKKPAMPTELAELRSEVERLTREAAILRESGRFLMERATQITERLREFEADNPDSPREST
jgi:hypothetical protein